MNSLNIMSRTASLVLWAALASPAHAEPDNGIEVEQAEDAFYCQERKLGIWFYCERPRESPGAAASPQPSARSQLAAISGTLEELKARAILEPSPENVTAYVRFQREQLDRSSMFADVWQRALWQDPGLDYTLQRPVSTLGKRAWIDQRKTDRDLAMARLSERYGVFYFYASSCGACDILVPSSRPCRTSMASRCSPFRWTAGRVPPSRTMSSMPASTNGSGSALTARYPRSSCSMR